MKYLIIILTISFSYVFSQEEWINYSVEDDISVQLPAEPSALDTPGAESVIYESDNYIIFISKVGNSGPKKASISGEDDLDKFYAGFTNGYVKSANGKLLDKASSKISNLKSVNFKMHSEKDGVYRLNFVSAFFVNNCTYVFQFLQFEEDNDTLKARRDKFFNSIMVSTTLLPKDQYTGEKKSAAYEAGEIFGSILLYLVIILIPVIYFLRRRKRKKAETLHAE